MKFLFRFKRSLINQKLSFSGFRTWNGLDQNTRKDVFKQSVEVFEPRTEYETAVRFLNPPTMCLNHVTVSFLLKVSSYYTEDIWNLCFHPERIKCCPSTLLRRNNNWSFWRTLAGKSQLERLSMTFTANGKRQKWNVCRFSSAVCTVEWNYLYLQ